ncbi:hypothetical protein PFISCL1PPCAC_11113, partial [Pristionchus fissidentatus]
ISMLPITHPMQLLFLLLLTTCVAVPPIKDFWPLAVPDSVVPDSSEFGTKGNYLRFADRITCPFFSYFLVQYDDGTPLLTSMNVLLYDRTGKARWRTHDNEMNFGLTDNVKISCVLPAYDFQEGDCNFFLTNALTRLLSVTIRPRKFECPNSEKIMVITDEYRYVADSLQCNPHSREVNNFTLITNGVDDTANFDDREETITVHCGNYDPKSAV